MKRPMTLHFYRSGSRVISPATTDVPVYIEELGTFWRWRIRASNGRVIADSGEAYGRLRDAARGADLVIGDLFDVQERSKAWRYALAATSEYVRPGCDATGVAASGRSWRVVVDA